MLKEEIEDKHSKICICSVPQITLTLHIKYMVKKFLVHFFYRLLHGFLKQFNLKTFGLTEFGIANSAVLSRDRALQFPNNNNKKKKKLS